MLCCWLLKHKSKDKKKKTEEKSTEDSRCSRTADAAGGGVGGAMVDTLDVVGTPPPRLSVLLGWGEPAVLLVDLHERLEALLGSR